MPQDHKGRFFCTCHGKDVKVFRFVEADSFFWMLSDLHFFSLSLVLVALLFYFFRSFFSPSSFLLLLPLALLGRFFWKTKSVVEGPRLAVFFLSSFISPNTRSRSRSRSASQTLKEERTKQHTQSL